MFTMRRGFVNDVGSLNPIMYGLRLSRGAKVIEDETGIEEGSGVTGDLGIISLKVVCLCMKL